MSIDFSKLPCERLEAMHEAGVVVGETMRVMQKSQTNVVAEILKTTDEFLQWNHVPPDDVYDRETHSQYYYHAHERSESGDGLHDDEHGHFHTFIRGKGMPARIKPLDVPGYDPGMEISEVNAHVIGIGMDQAGAPIRLFTVNRWVSGETWFKGEDINAMLDLYNVDDLRPSWPVNLWVTNMIHLFRPQIEQLILQRDKSVAKWADKHPGENVYEDRALEVTSHLDVNLIQQINGIEAALSVKAA